MHFKGTSFKQSFWVLAIIVVFISGVNAQKFGKISNEEWQIGAPADYPEANAIILFEKRNMQVTHDKIIIDHHVRVKLMTQSGIEDHGEWAFSFHEKYDKIKGFKAHTITPDGKKHKIEKDAIFEKESGSWKTRTFAFPALEEGCIIEYRYTSNSKRFRNLKPWYFQNTIYTMLSEFTVELFTGFEYDYLTANIVGAKRRPEVSERLDASNTGFGTKKIKIFTWSLENLPPIKDEPYMSSEDDYRSNLKFQLVSFTYNDGSKTNYLDTWSELGRKVQLRIDDFNNKENDIKKIALNVTDGLTSEAEKSQAIFKYVRDNFSSIDEYNSYFFNHEKLSKGLEEKIETPEGKNILVSAMHNAVGIPSWPVLISTRDNSKFNPKYPSTRQFNYFISFVQFEQQWEFLDVSNRNSLYGVLPPNCLTDGGFLIDGSNSSLIKMSPKQVSSYRVDTTLIYIDEAGHAVCSTNCLMGGYYAASYASKLDKSTLEEFMEDNFYNRVDGVCTVTDSSCYLDSLNNFVMNVNYETDDILRQLDTDVAIKPVILAYTNNTFKSEKRFFPVDFNYPFIYQNVVQIKYAKTPTEIYMPDDIKEEIGGAAFYRVSKYENQVIEVMQQLVIDNPVFRPGSYGQIKGLFEKVAQSSEDEVALVITP